MNQIERRLKTVARRLQNVRMARDMTIRDAAQRGMSCRQIAEPTGLSPEQVAQILARAT
jgi:hypothetical protein